MPINESDDVLVVATLHLPAGNGVLVKELQFNNRLALDGEYLEYRWGQASEGKATRYRVQGFHAKTWQEAFDMATEHCERELGKLESALEKRVRVLMDAEG